MTSCHLEPNKREDRRLRLIADIETTVIILMSNLLNLLGRSCSLQRHRWLECVVISVTAYESEALIQVWDSAIWM